jgi:hypothetical protein
MYAEGIETTHLFDHFAAISLLKMAPSADPPASNGRINGADIHSCPFTIENIPFGVISTEQNPHKRCATAFKEWAIDLEILEYSGLFAAIAEFSPGIFSNACALDIC